MRRISRVCFFARKMFSIDEAEKFNSGFTQNFIDAKIRKSSENFLFAKRQQRFSFVFALFDFVHNRKQWKPFSCDAVRLRGPFVARHFLLVSALRRLQFLSAQKSLCFIYCAVSPKPSLFALPSVTLFALCRFACVFFALAVSLAGRRRRGCLSSVLPIRNNKLDECTVSVLNHSFKVWKNANM